MRSNKTTSRSSSGIGTLDNKKGHYISAKSIKRSSMPKKVGKEILSNFHEEEKIIIPKRDSKKNMIEKKKLSTLKTLKKSLSKTHKNITKGLFKKDSSNASDEIDLVLGRPKSKNKNRFKEEYHQEQLGFSSDEDGSFIYTNIEDADTEDVDIEDVSNCDVDIQNEDAKNVVAYENKIMHDEIEHNVTKPRKKHARNRSVSRSKAVTRKMINGNLSKNDNYSTKYKEDDDSTSNEDGSEFAQHISGQLTKQDYSVPVEENSEHSCNSSTIPEKPVIRTLKKTFTSMLSRIQISRNTTDTSSSDNESVHSNTSQQTQIERLNQIRKRSGHLGRAKSETSLKEKFASKIHSLYLVCS